MLDVTEQLHRYAEAVGDLVPERHHAPAVRGRQRPRRLVAAAAVLLLVAAGAAVALDMGRNESHVATQAAAGGTVHGTLQLVGGRPGAEPVAVAGTIEVKRSDSGRTVSIETTEEGQFVIELEPGEYSLEGRSPQYIAGGQPCRARDVVEVRPGETSTVTVNCEMR